MIEVLKPGLLTSIQDHGRHHARAWGVPVSGAMDRISMDLANTILNNETGSSVLEISLIGPELVFQKETWFCLAGADLSPRLDDQLLEMQCPVKAKPGDVLKFGRSKYGIRTYMAISGGFEHEIILGSCSQYHPVTPTARLIKGDLLKFSAIKDVEFHSGTHLKMDDSVFKMSDLDVFTGPEYNALTSEQKNKIWTSEFTISPQNNRMAYQVEELITNDLKPIITSHVMPGTVQLTPSGKLILLMRDAQTTGGYPRILQLSEEGINRLSQKYTGDIIRFKRIDY